MSAPGVSLKKHGLRADNLNCPLGGLHEVPVARLVPIAAQGGGTVHCLRCRQVVTLTAIEGDRT